MSYKKFSNFRCEYYPCHDSGNINCLFCFCPLHAYKNCGGQFLILKSGIKDCSNCLVPHSDQGYEYIINFITTNPIMEK